MTALLLLLAPAAAPVEYNRDVRPILSDACFPCHGPDAARRKADLRLDTSDGARVVAELARRVSSTKAGERMPPASTGRTLTPVEIDVLKRWVAGGATYQKHWAFLPPVRPASPTVRDDAWPRGPLDRFVLSRLEREGLTPAPAADKLTLLRRVTLDLTGLPPSVAEVDAYLADASPAAYERAVDRLLASPRHGERMASRWLDAARYADTSGYQSDGERFMWRWRDWVLDAYNANLPFDRFTLEQTAGDLLPTPTLEQRIATGFHRNHRGNGEGGIIPEEYAAEYVADRVETTSTVWLGLTVGCARCHDHKFDPVAQKEFYQLFALFNNVPEQGRAVKYGNSPPYIPAPTPLQREALGRLDDELAAAKKSFDGLSTRIADGQPAWEKTLTARSGWEPTGRLTAHVTRDTAKVVGGEAASVESPAGPGVDLDGLRSLDGGDVGGFGFYDKFSLGLWVRTTAPSGTLVSRMTDVPRGDGYGVQLDGGRVLVHMTKRWLDDALRVRSERRIDDGQWHHLAVTYDGSRVASGVHVFLDGRPVKQAVLLDELNQSFHTKEPFRVGAGGGPEARFCGQIADVRIYGGALTPEDVLTASIHADPADVAVLPESQRSPGQKMLLRRHYLQRGPDERVRAAHARLTTAARAQDAFVEAVPTVMVLEEMPTPRETFVLIRGQYDKKGTRTFSDVPAALPPWPAGSPRNRLGLAKWMIDPAHPLTARVAVNRLWQMLFGVGIVKTVDDFGSQGDWPSHPELLDWLATEFVAGEWDVKAMLRKIVTSATYRQSSRLTPALLHRDPENRLLARGPRYRLPAEAIRDQALAASGLLVERVGGPSVRPYQPAGLWKELTGVEDYVADTGENLYRRSLYTYWKRTVAPPAMMTFDAAGRETCVVRETRTNTPLQALNLMNDVTFIEAARVLAARVMTDETTTDGRLDLAFRRVVARPPRPAELAVLRESLAHHRATYARDRVAAEKLTAAGEWPRDRRHDVAEHAAYTAVVGMLFNLDEALTKE